MVHKKLMPLQSFKHEAGRVMTQISQINRKICSLIAALFLLMVPAQSSHTSSTSEILNQGIDFGDWKQTKSLCEQILQKDPGNPDALIASARLNSLNGKNRESISVCNKVLAVRPRFAPALLCRGLLTYRVGKFEDGKTDLKMYLMLTKSANDIPTRSCRAFVFGYLNESNSLNNVCESIVSETGSAKLPADIFNRGFALIGLKKFKEARETLAKLEQKRVVAPMLLFLLGHCDSENRNFALALKEFAAAAEQAPDHFANQGAWGNAFEKLKKYDEAILHYDRALQIEEHYLFGLRGRGRCYSKKQNYNLALKDFSKAIAIEPDNVYTILQRADTYATLRQNIKAHGDYATALRIDPKNAYAYYSRSLLFRDEKQFAKSIADLSKAIKINPTDASYFCARGCAEVRNHNYQLAIADCNKSIQLNPKRDHPYLSRGEAYLAVGKYDFALRDFNRFIENNPKYSEAFAERAEVYKKLHKTKLAALDLERSRQLKQAEHL